MVRIGIVGIGFMGMIHYLAAQRIKGARVAAICSGSKKKRAGDWRSIKGNFGPPGAMMDLSKMKAYDRLSALLADPEIDLVDVCTPTQTHRSIVVAALEAGKHVLVEKPIALQTRDADAMLKAAERAGRLLMVAQVVPFFPEFGYAAEVMRDGRYGRVRAAHLKRIISRPDWSSDTADFAKTGGPAIDLHIHDAHFIALVCGLPRRVSSTGLQENGTILFLTTQYLYGDSGPAVSCTSGVVAQKGRPFVHGFEIYLEKASLIFDSSSGPPTVFTADGRSFQPKLRAGDVIASTFAVEMQAAVDAVRSGVAPDELSGRLARDALAICHKEIQSVRTGRAAPVA